MQRGGKYRAQQTERASCVERFCEKAECRDAAKTDALLGVYDSGGICSGAPLTVYCGGVFPGR